MFCHINRYWEKTSSLENLRSWLPDDPFLISVDESSKDGDDGIITVLCGKLTCEFGVKTYRYAGYRERRAVAYSTV